VEIAGKFYKPVFLEKAMDWIVSEKCIAQLKNQDAEERDGQRGRLLTPGGLWVESEQRYIAHFKHDKQETVSNHYRWSHTFSLDIVLFSASPCTLHSPFSTVFKLLK
jgi:hypothetical protein